MSFFSIAMQAKTMCLTTRGFGPACLVLCFLLLQACVETKMPEGVVATVNGEPIYLHSLQAVLDSRAAGLGIPAQPSLEMMKSQYGSALGTLIIHALVRQDLSARKLSVSEASVDEAIAQIRAEFKSQEDGGTVNDTPASQQTGEAPTPKEDNAPTLTGLNKFLAESSLNESDWRSLMRDYLSLERLQNEVLLPKIRITLPELRSYYQEHESDWQIPDTLGLCFIAAGSREAVSELCAQLGNPSGKNDFLHELQCTSLSSLALPPPWSKEVKNLKKLPSCLGIQQQDGLWQSIAVLEQQKARKLEPAEAFPLIERILQEQKKQDIFAKWLEKQLSQASIKVSPVLKASLLKPQAVRFASGESEENDDAY